MPKRTRNESPQKQAMREIMRNYLKNNDVHVKNGADVNSVMKDMMSVLLEGVLDEELDEDLGYSKYDYHNKNTDNSRNGHSSKTMHTSYGDMDIAIPRDSKGTFEPQVIKKYQNTVTQDMEEKIISMYAKGMTTGDIESHLQELYVYWSSVFATLCSKNNSISFLLPLVSDNHYKNVVLYNYSNSHICQ